MDQQQAPNIGRNIGTILSLVSFLLLEKESGARFSGPSAYGDRQQAMLYISKLLEIKHKKTVNLSVS